LGHALPIDVAAPQSSGPRMHVGMSSGSKWWPWSLDEPTK
jgi:hypothetical protein